MKYLSLIFLMACASKSVEEVKFEKLLAKGECQEALANLPETTTGKVLSKTGEAVGTGASYILTGLSYGTEYLIKVTTGVTSVVVLCGLPTLAMTAASGGRTAQAACFVDPMQANKALTEKVKFGEKSYRSTASWRCPNVDHLAHAIRQVSSCYEDQGDKKNAQVQLESVANNPTFKQCLGKDEMEKVEKELMRLQRLSSM